MKAHTITSFSKYLRSRNCGGCYLWVYWPQGQDRQGPWGSRAITRSLCQQHISDCDQGHEDSRVA